MSFSKDRTGLRKFLFLGFIFSVVLAGASPCAAAEIPTVEWSELSDKGISPKGKVALSLDPGCWKHAETAHFITHFTDEKGAETVTIHAEVYYGWIKELFGVTGDEWTRKVHVFVFEKEDQWKNFTSRVGPGSHAGAFTTGWELFIYRSPFWLSPMKTMAHEMTHVIAFRFLDGPVPLFLDEGLAEFVSYRALAMQLGRSEFDIRTVKLVPEAQFIPLVELAAITRYPEGRIELFYQESELLARFLIFGRAEGKDFYRLLREVSKGVPFRKAAETIYETDFETLEQKFKDYAVRGKLNQI